MNILTSFLSSSLAVGLLLFSNSPVEAGSMRFPDVATHHENYKAIEDLAARGIINGYTDGYFRPGNTVTRTEALKILLLGAGVGVDAGDTGITLGFPDVDKGEWFVPFIKAAQDKGIVRGYEDGLFRPHRTVNRVESLKMLLLSFGIDPTNDLVLRPPYTDVPMGIWYTPFAQYARANALVDPNATNTFNTTVGMTRGDLAEMTYRLIQKLNQ